MHRLRLRVTVWLTAAIVVVLLLAGAAGGKTSHTRAACTHGISSIGPVEIVNGQVVGGSTTPHTEACLP